ncbi:MULTISPECIES: hypothetical protein [Archaeoglobus]|jgi:hypothetical protein|uniref:Uncharacterized protein AF_0585 n=2 Tax=Archaeoglobus fulgidus TaxID=2234 RepID=Y585_ARCFU|nr:MULTISPECIES: hypothetical protein [Archaeoglobus]O29670.1 RecName: Full=Uncharacterized protein AF_0585 [Archaeoglobus fulgidus DSM 4304]AAB90659.1 predicted coding region AF_0585 [Archaeoglobus fulgidus DSM 4304]AIG97461.1 hypothetical protein AFULGI_00006600 [Archaeoglobus fulgidus DSM 8774]MDI3498039.1 hypothetical protein [Archaeoglobus sp.]
MGDYFDILTLILTAIYLLIGGGFIIYIYDTYKRTKQEFLIYLSIGFFLLIIGASLPVLTFVAQVLDMSVVVVAILMQIAGLSSIFYSIVR